MSTQVQVPFYVGTYTKGNSEGIYKYELNPTGKLMRVGLVAKTENPSFLGFNKEHTVLLAVNENEQGMVRSYAIQPDSLEQLSVSSSGGSYPCFVATNEEGFVLTANYGSGNVGLLELNNSGKLSDLLDVDQHEGKGTTDRQEGPHAHSAWFGEENKVISVDLGTNDLWFSTLNEQDKKLEPNDPRTIQLIPGSGPRHLAFHPSKEWIFVLSELNNNVTRFAMENGNYKEADHVSILDENFKGESTGADIHISKDGRFVYASTRGSDTIAIIEISEDGAMTVVDHVATRGEHPRNFGLSPSENFLVVANKDSNNLVSFKRNPETGLLTYVSEISAPNPVCVLFE
ncbi:lactonase family protein [Flavimarina sp. Hel_I_48]|uniref:lactonase family protein n=1 Tax=Flavimarina sp. Hel_I_48 TaxID=1392488 RepID=UPI0019D03EE3|nr:lactonase family protein [Flavimarina sp. Hel_I_48]